MSVHRHSKRMQPRTCVEQPFQQFRKTTGGAHQRADLKDNKNIARGQTVYPDPLDRTHASAQLPDLAAVFEQVASAPS